MLARCSAGTPGDAQYPGAARCRLVRWSDTNPRIVSRRSRERVERPATAGVVEVVADLAASAWGIMLAVLSLRVSLRLDTGRAIGTLLRAILIILPVALFFGCVLGFVVAGSPVVQRSDPELRADRDTVSLDPVFPSAPCDLIVSSPCAAPRRSVARWAWDRAAWRNMALAARSVTTGMGKHHGEGRAWLRGLAIQDERWVRGQS